MKRTCPSGRRRYGYQILVKPEGEEHYLPTSIVFRTSGKIGGKLHSAKVRASTYAGVETIAGMGEDYQVKKILLGCKRKRGGR